MITTGHPPIIGCDGPGTGFSPTPSSFAYPQSDRIDLRAGQIHTGVGLRLIAGGTVRGRVSGGDTSAPVEGAFVFVDRGRAGFWALFQAPYIIKQALAEGEWAPTAGTPASGATVTLERAGGALLSFPVFYLSLSPSGPTDAEGRFLRGLLPAGDYRIGVEMEGFERAETRRTMGPGEEVSWTVDLVPKQE